MGEAAVRGTLGISLDAVAEHLGVTRPTLTKYELNPRAGVEDEGRRAAIARFYRELEALVKRTKGSARKAGRDEAGGDLVAGGRASARRSGKVGARPTELR